MRGVMFQYFEWNCGAGSLWNDVAAKAQELANLGTTAVWLPPAYKGMGGSNDTGYAPYDLFDLGEFEQKGSVATKYGTKDEYLAAVKAIQDAGMDAYADVVLNHKMGGDEMESVDCLEMDQNDRNKVLREVTIKTWSKYNFAARQDKYSTFKWRAEHFNSFGHNAEANWNGVFLRKGNTFSGEVDFEMGNYDHLMGDDVNQYHPEVRAELMYWGEWYKKFTGVNGFRLDAVKHMPSSFYKDWFANFKEKFPDKETFGVGEFWSPEVGKLEKYLADVDGCIRLFDVPLHFHLHQASEQGRDYDMRLIFEGTLVKNVPLLSVIFVDNHDSQPGQSLQSPVKDWFKPMAYALILLREHGYPCLFYGDYFGSEGDCNGFNKLTNFRKQIDDLLIVRHKNCFGTLTDFFDHAQCVGWSWSGNDEGPGCAVVMSTGEAGFKSMKIGNKGETYRDVTGNSCEPITTGEGGAADFTCPAGSISVWTKVESIAASSR
jgi:alpha-amylase